MTTHRPGAPRFAERVCLVTGSTGMAASAARALADEAAAVFVASRTAAHARNLAETIAAAGGRVAWQAADVSLEKPAEDAVSACVSAFGRLDCVYNVAGISGRSLGDGPLHEMTLAGWQAVVAANATSIFLVCRAAIRQMLSQERRADGQRGVILNMSSVLGRHPAPRFFGTHGYAATKGAIEAFSRSIAAYYAAEGIRVNAIAPGLVATPMSRRAQGDPEIVAYARARQPLARGVLDPDDVTATALYLLSDESRMVTGQILAVDGGWSVSDSVSPGSQ